MNIIETALVFGGIPLGLALVLAVAVYGKSLVSSQSRYRPGRPWTYPAVWYLPHPEHDSLPSTSSAAALPVGSNRAAASDSERMGGASGEW